MAGEITSIDKFYTEIFKANKAYVLEAWEDWNTYVSEYPDGFKDFLVEKLERDIKTNTKNLK